MTRNSIVQFVRFTSNLASKEFVSLCEPYAKELNPGSSTIITQELTPTNEENKFRYISQHRNSSPDFRFAFMKEKRPAQLHEARSRMVQAGGYLQVQEQCEGQEVKNDVRVFAFVTQPQADLKFFHRQLYRHLNIYEAYFENCVYNYIMEFFIQSGDAQTLVHELKTTSGVEAAIHKQCFRVQTAKSSLGTLL